MQTKTSLENLVPTFCKYIAENNHRLVHAKKLQDIFEGQLLTYLLALLRSEMSERAYSRMVPRVVPINVLTKIVNKLSKLYATPVKRVFKTTIDEKIADKSIDVSKLNTVFGLANKLYNLHQYFALEPFFHNSILKTRVLDASQFLVWTDDDTSKEMNVFLKYMGGTGDKQLWFAYSELEFWAFDTSGKSHPEYLADNQGRNPLGVIPFVYVNQYQTKLMPQPDSDVYEMVLRIPQLLSDLNYAHKFQAHSMVYGIDLDPTTEIDGNPDGFSLFSSREGEGKSGKIDFLKPQVEIEPSLKLIMSELGLWLETKGIKAGAIGTADVSLSGIAKILDEMDTTQTRQEQVEVFSGMESEFWKLYSTLHNYYLPLIDGKSVGMTEDPLISISFGEQKPLEDEKAKIERIKLKLEAGLTSKRRAVSEANPDLSSGDLDKLILEIEEESAKFEMTSASTNSDIMDGEPED